MVEKPQINQKMHDNSLNHFGGYLVVKHVAILLTAVIDQITAEYLLHECLVQLYLHSLCVYSNTSGINCSQCKYFA